VGRTRHRPGRPTGRDRNDVHPDGHGRLQLLRFLALQGSPISSGHEFQLKGPLEDVKSRLRVTLWLRYLETRSRGFGGESSGP
jgi:hypothetical protein